jgi:hypothetical protein
MKAQFFIVRLNGERLPHLVSATKADAKQFIRGYETSTHMGQWRRIDGGYEYSTTIGRYYTFKKPDTDKIDFLKGNQNE